MTKTRDLLIEIGTEELPPKSLRQLAAAFAEAVHDGLVRRNLTHGVCRWYATPRRLAVMVRDLVIEQQDQEIVRRGPAIAAAFDKTGTPTKAAQGFAKACGVAVAKLENMKTEQGEWLSYRTVEKGKQTVEVLPEVTEQALSAIPIPKRMRWGDNDIEFIRPAHWLVLMFGSQKIPCTILGVNSDNKTRGHRFHHPDVIELNSPAEYIPRLMEPGCVIADFEERQNRIRLLADSAARELGGKVLINSDLLHEVTSLVEWPVVITGSFDKTFLKLPIEVLVAVMQDHQKYFPVLDADNNLLPVFIAIANIESKNPDEIKRGNERVIRPRLTDAAFFWKRDCIHPLAYYRGGLKDVVFQRRLGSLEDKTERVRKLAVFIAEELDIDQDRVAQAAVLAKCDLSTEMVGEFPELQGTMGRYYAIESGIDPEVAQALDEQYMPRYAGAVLPESMTGRILALADKLDTIMGIFAIGQPPTGEKDPFGLRRSALGCLRIIIECGLSGLDLESCLMFAAETFDNSLMASIVIGDVFDFMMERLRRYYLDEGIRVDVFDAVLARRPKQPFDFHQRIQAVSVFTGLPEAESLAAANKRIVNILRQAGWGDMEGDVTAKAGPLLVDAQEKELNRRLADIARRIAPLISTGKYTDALRELASLREPVDAFFDKVMVMVENEDLRHARLRLLSDIHREFQHIADISLLQSHGRD